MHKKIRAVLASLSCLVLLSNSNANDIEPSKEFYTAIHRGTAPVVLDGILNEWTGVPVLSDPRIAVRIGQEGIGGAPTAGSKGGGGADGNYLLFERYAGGTWSGPDDHTSAVEVVWDADNVYFGFIVTDDYHNNTSGNAWNGDSVQLMIANATRSGTRQGIDYFLYNYALGGTEDEPVDPATGTIIHHEAGPGGTTAVVSRDSAAKKTYYEIQLPASALGLTPPLVAGMKFGLGMAINDGDAGDQAGQKGWGGLGAHSIVFGKTASETALVTLSSATPGTDIIFFSSINPTVTNFTFRVTDKGTSISDPATAKLRINGAIVPLTQTAKSPSGSIDFTYTPAGPLPPGANTYAIEVKDTNGGIASESATFNLRYLAAANKVTPDTTKRGFIWKVHQNSRFTANTFARAVNQLAGKLGPNLANPAAQGPALAAATPNTSATTNQPITFEIPGVINLNIDLTAPQGNDLSDEQMPGTPGLDLTPDGTGTGLNDGIAADILTYVELTAGNHTFIVNSDDGFRTFVGRVNDIFRATFAAGFDGGRGAADTTFDLFVAEAGTYAFRTIFEQGGGGGNIELLEQLADGTKVLLNADTAGGPKTYRSATGADVSGPTVITSVTPLPDAINVNGAAPIVVEIAEGTDTVPLNTIRLTVNGSPVTVTPTKSGNLITVSYTPSPALSNNAPVTATIAFTAGGVARTETWNFKTAFFGAGTLFIEAEDFNFGHGQWVQDQPIGMTGPYTGGAYQDKGTGRELDPDGVPILHTACDGTDWGIDYNDNNVQDDPPNTAIYRPTTTVEAAKRNGPAGLNRGYFDVEVNHTVGWTSSAEWMNYTRQFPAQEKVYKVYARMAHGDAAAGIRRGGVLWRVTSDPTVCNQTTEQLGTFGGPWTGGWDTWPEAGTPQDALLEMTDASGSPVLIKLSGLQTLRFQYANNAGDIDYLAFVPQAVTILPPKIISLKPGAGSSGAPVTAPFEAVLEDTDATVGTVTLKLNGTTVTPTVTKSGKQTTVRFTPTTLLAAGSANTYELTFTDSSGGTTVRAVNFSVTYTPLPPGTLFIEAEDFNFGKGQTITDQPIGMTGPYPGGAFQGKGTGFTVDGSGALCDGSDLGVDYADNAVHDSEA
ncbi:MAG TPA: sugar-binding protein, partial [Verrucomicrobiae bacterium]|nr:sugar-binding protein [Verrucomicrobiae bacterium]